MSNLCEVSHTASQPLTLSTVCGGTCREAACKLIHLELTKTCCPVAIKFRNHYTYTISVLIEREDSWCCVVNSWKCMRETPHCETGGQNWILIDTIPATINDTTKICLVLRQPSPVWRDFLIKDVTVYCHRNQENVPPSNDMAETVASKLMKMAVNGRASTVRNPAPLYSNIQCLATD